MISTAPLRRLMIERDISLEFLAMTSGINIETLKKLEIGKSVTPSNLNVLCKVLDCNPEDLIEYESECNYCTKPLGDFKFCPMCGRILL